MMGKRAFQGKDATEANLTRMEVSCGDTNMDWPKPGAVLHMEWYSEAVLPAIRKDRLPAETDGTDCQRETRLTKRETLTVEEYTHMGSPKGIKPYGHLAQYRDWPETRAS